MASSMMHLAVVQEMKKKIRFQNAERLDLGVILPDAAVDGNSHLKRSICGGTKDTYDLEFFREKFGEQMKQDDLYLGYYLHLVQDLYYRNYLYVENHWNSAIPGNVEKLHHDYCVLNGRISQRYGLSKTKFPLWILRRSRFANLLFLMRLDLLWKYSSSLRRYQKRVYLF